MYKSLSTAAEMKNKKIMLFKKPCFNTLDLRVTK